MFGTRDPGTEIQDQGSGKNSSRIRKKFIPDPDPWGKKAPDPGSATLRVIFMLSRISGAFLHIYGR
jgi:hypothetical protein